MVQAALLRAVEDGIFRPVGSDKEKRSNFHLIAGTNRDLRLMVEAGTFREDLLARINLWTFRMPSLTERREDIAPNLDFELAKAEKKAGKRFIFEKAARERYLAFAVSTEALWRGNFRDLSASVQRLTTLSNQGRIDMRNIERELERLLESWGSSTPVFPVPHKNADRIQTALMLIEKHGSMTAAARNMPEYRNQKNPGDGLRKFLLRKGIKV